MSAIEQLRILSALRSNWDEPDLVGFGLTEYGRMLITRAATEKDAEKKKTLKLAEENLKNALEIWRSRKNKSNEAEVQALLKQCRWDR